jgi:LAO/AO transport system kinase
MTVFTQDGRLDIRKLAKTISVIENEENGYEELLKSLPHRDDAKIIGITGPPGAGKSTLTDALIADLVNKNKKVAVLCIDPSSPFNKGALLGDRIRMNEWFNNPSVYIRSLATRGELGGLHPKIIEIADLLKTEYFDYVIIETVGVGQTEVEIAGLADATVVLFVPESGDEIQTMKAGLMEIADIFVVNKADRPGADAFAANLKQLVKASSHKIQGDLPVLKTVATEKQGIHELTEAIEKKLKETSSSNKKVILLTEKLFHLIQRKRMQDVDKQELQKLVEKNLAKGSFNLYDLAERHSRFG